MEKYKHFIDKFYIIMLLVFACIVLWPIFHYDGPTLSQDFFKESISYSEGWTTSDGTEINIAKLQKIENNHPYETYSIYNTLPSYLPEGMALCFRTKNIFFQVYLDGELIYDPYVPESIVYTKSYGTDWNYVGLPSNAAGKVVEFRYSYVYTNARACIDNLYIGSPAGNILSTFQEKIVALVTCVLLIFVGLLLIICDIPINMRTHKNHELRYLGLFSLTIALWCLSETNLLQYFIGDSRAMLLLSCGSLMLIPIPTVLYLDSAFGLNRKWLIPLISTLSTMHFVISWGLHFLGILDVHETITISHIMLGIMAVILFVVIVKTTFVQTGNESPSIFRILRGIGLSGIAIATIIDLIRYYRGNGNDSAMFVRMGLLIFIICFGISSLERTINAVKLGIRTEFVSQLAYQDGLTRIGNRTAFEEKLAELEATKEKVKKIGIIIFDINDLKYVNDHLGHHLGDDMLVETAELISQSFLPQNGTCYRIGGDEFSVLLDGENVEERFCNGIDTFIKLTEEFNSQPKKDFRVSVAHGFAMYDQSIFDLTLTKVYETADKLMYDNKTEMKSKQPSPEQYYQM